MNTSGIKIGIGESVKEHGFVALDQREFLD